MRILLWVFMIFYLILFAGCSGTTPLADSMNTETALFESANIIEPTLQPSLQSATKDPDEKRSVVEKLIQELPPTSSVIPENPYYDHSERSDSWRFEIFEVFRGADKLCLDGVLNYEQDYSKLITRGDMDKYEILHRFKCKISFPQSTNNEPWAEKINEHYQTVFDLYIKEGDDIWEEYRDDWDAKIFGCYYESAYLVNKIITVVCSRQFYGNRQTISWNPYTELFSSADGHKLNIDELFSVGSEEYLLVLRQSLSNATTCFSEYKNDGAGDGQKPISQERMLDSINIASIAVAPIGLVFIFPTGVADCNAAGNIFVHVPYEDLKGILNDEYFTDF